MMAYRKLNKCLIKSSCKIKLPWKHKRKRVRNLRQTEAEPPYWTYQRKSPLGQYMSRCSPCWMASVGCLDTDTGSIAGKQTTKLKKKIPRKIKKAQTFPSSPFASSQLKNVQVSSKKPSLSQSNSAQIHRAWQYHSLMSADNWHTTHFKSMSSNVENVFTNSSLHCLLYGPARARSRHFSVRGSGFKSWFHHVQFEPVGKALYRHFLMTFRCIMSTWL